MHPPRFYCPMPLAAGLRVVLPDAVARHAVGALRLRHGDALVLFNGEGGEYHGSLEKVGKHAEAQLSDYREPARESPLTLTLVQGLSTAERMDFTLQKAVELGIAAIQPVQMRRSVVHLDAAKRERRRLHWQGVVAAACEQCGRNYLPTVAPLVEFADWLRGDALAGQAAFILDPGARQPLRDLPPPTTPLLLVVGPEGGFDPAEHAAALAAGCQPLRLGPRVLRTETAAMVAIAALQTLWGDL